MADLNKIGYLLVFLNLTCFLFENWKINYPHLAELVDKARYLLARHKNISIRWIPRELNKAGHILDEMKH